MFSNRAEENGMKVHRAADAGEACVIIGRIASSNGARLVVKSKSMLTEEIDLNTFLEGEGIEVVETDLGEFVAQISGERPSHIVAPIIHKSKSEVIEVYSDKLVSPPLETAEEITAYTRKLLREKFLNADIGVTGANFGLAEDGTVVIVENEGNVRLCSTLPRIHVVVMGIERLLPSLSELPVFLRLLTGSATGQSITNYVSLIRSPRLEREKDGPDEIHLVLVDNGRSSIYQDPDLREVLHCLRCGACLNVCPIYQRVGGHTYGWVYPGPIGSVVSPLLTEESALEELPFLSTLCGRCREVCPVKIEIEKLLVRLRRRAVEGGRRNILERTAFGIFSLFTASPVSYRVIGKLTRAILRYPSGVSFHQMWKKRKGRSG
jgi:L-lactate dehydrogenase complex protein LldF